MNTILFPNKKELLKNRIYLTIYYIYYIMYIIFRKRPQYWGLQVNELNKYLSK